MVCVKPGFCILDGAFNLFKELQLIGISPDSVMYGTLINGLQIAGREDDAFMLLEEMKEDTFAAFNLWLRYLKSLPKRDERIITLVEECLRKDEVERGVRQGKLSFAVEVFLYALQKGFILKPRICNNLLNSLLRSRYIDDAFDLMEKMDSCGYNLDDYLDVGTRFLVRNHQRQKRCSSEDRKGLPSEFCNMVRRNMICSTRDVKKMKAGSKFPFANDNETSASLEVSEN
ncbi:pentatricopeptide repeat-containing protein [Tanacetum coccineum]